ncbi:MAG: methylenetetrahydrofolate--tRNA-(uracil(54)-C(5))-methyltransferase (FADH(2)-oxidizing) TrmFO [Clostridia bacterium]|nr:methylenetetrahydrofolate--tRNA-(uracil(54)-C(5))-methyltransferase (FADH(2)-oxidizing) TrmFO [Clostridia bacterium]
MNHTVTVVGAGLAGSEAAWQLARRGINVELWEMKPHEMTPAHHSAGYAELVCSNSLRGAGLATAPGLLKEELRRAGSLIMEAADATAVPAGGALAVDREAFSAYITEKIKNHPRITVREGRVDDIPAGPCIMATGPLTDGVLAENIDKLFGGEPMHFYDAAAPIVSFASIDMESAYFASRYDKGTADYINCPMNKEQYLAFVEALKTAKEAPVHGFEDKAVFEGCMPVEVMARRGEDTLRFGPMKPVGLTDPRTGERPYAVVQLRADNAEKTAFNIVGFQTHLMHPEQKRVFGMIPALAKAEYYRYGTMHRNSFIRSPGRLDRHYRVIGREELFFAGQITGVEGYIESTASGLCCGINMARQLRGKEPMVFPHETALGALSLHISQDPELRFDPMNINFGIIKGLDTRIRNKQERYTATSLRALDILESLRPQMEEDIQ